MLGSFATGLFAMVLVSVAWLGVMNAWRRVFPDSSTDPDVLAGRGGCHVFDGCDECDGCNGHERSCTPASGEEDR